MVSEPEHAIKILQTRLVTRSETYPDDAIGATKEFYLKRNDITMPAIFKEMAALRDPGFQYWVALEEGIIMAGFARIIKGERQSLDMMHVMPNFQRQGLGNQLLELATDALDGTRPAFLEVVDGNNSAMEWYVRHGWRNIGETLDGTPLPNGTFVPEHVMVLDPITEQ